MADQFGGRARRATEVPRHALRECGRPRGRCLRPVPSRPPSRGGPAHSGRTGSQSRPSRKVSVGGAGHSSACRYGHDSYRRPGRTAGAGGHT